MMKSQVSRGPTVTLPQPLGHPLRLYIMAPEAQLLLPLLPPQPDLFYMAASERHAGGDGFVVKRCGGGSSHHDHDEW